MRHWKTQFGKWKLRTKLTVILMITSTVAVFLGGLANILFVLHESRLNHGQQLETIVDMIGYNSQAALAFNIAEDAEKLLSSLDADTSVILACIYDADGKILAMYRQADQPEDLVPPDSPVEGKAYTDRNLHIFHRVYLDDESIGSVYLLDDRREEIAQAKRHTVGLLLVMIITLAVAYLISWQLQNVISKPILSLADTAMSIAEKEDYSIRAEKTSEDEVGALIDSFNGMLAQIQRGEKVLRQSEERYRTLVDNIGLGITLIDADYNILMANSAVGQLFGVDTFRLFGKKCYEQFEKCDLSCSHCPGLKSFESRHVEDVETEGVRDDGSRFPMRIRAFPMYDDAGNPTGFIEVIEDITEQRRAEKILRETQERFSDFFQNAPVGFHIFGPDQLIIDINDAELEMIGYSREEIVGKKVWADLIAPEQKDVFERHWENILSGEELTNIEYTLVNKDGYLVDVILNASARFDEDGNLINTRGSVLDISERKRMTEELRESQQMLKTILDTINVRVFWKDLDSRYLGYNRLFAEDAGAEGPDEIIGKEDSELVWRDKAQLYRRHDREVIESGRGMLKYETQQVTADGKSIWLSTSKIPLRDKDGVIIGVLGTYEDITERKRADLALRLSEQRFRAIADYTYNWELWISPEGRVLWTNPAVERVTGYSVEESMAMKDYPLVLAVKEDHKRIAKAFDEALGGGSGHMEYRIRRKDGKVIWVAASWQPIYDNKGVSQGHRTSLRDITDRKQAELDLGASRERFRNLVETTSDWIWEIDTNGVYTYVSPKVKDALGYEPEEVLGKTPWDLMPPDEAAKVSKAFKEAASGQQPVKGLENVNVHKDGHMVTLETNGVPFYDEYGDFSGYRGIDRDVTERKVAEEERERLLWILEAKNRELESIVYTSSHDLRSTIVNVQGFSCELATTCETLLDVLQAIHVPEDVKDTVMTIIQDEIPTELKYITTSASRMDMLIAGLLRLSRLGRAEMKAEKIDMNSLMCEVINSMKYQIRETGTEVSAGDLPHCKADAGQVTQIFWNLLDNAIKYRKRDVPCVIDISGYVEDDVSIYCVTDNGRGILQSHQKNIFEVFHRLEPEGSVAGEGLGLSIVRRIVDRHGGRVWVESSPGEGSRFFIALPGA